MTAERTRALSYRAARTCEEARSPASRCRCRCGGKGHGAGRGRPEDLPLDDPHSARPRPGTCRICGCTQRRPCVSGLLARAAPSHRVVAPPLLRPGEACQWLDRFRTFCSAHSREELEAWGWHLGPPHPRKVAQPEAGFSASGHAPVISAPGEKVRGVRVAPPLRCMAPGASSCAAGAATGGDEPRPPPPGPPEA